MRWQGGASAQAAKRRLQKPRATTTPANSEVHPVDPEGNRRHNSGEQQEPVHRQQAASVRVTAANRVQPQQR